VTLKAESNGISILAASDLPEKPSKTRMFGGRPQSQPQAQRLEVAKFGDFYQVRVLLF
jgi:hypothetical protein